MASEYRIHRPYVLAALPRPLDHTDGNIVAREVYGQREGEKKRKRTELVVGIDGETASIYDIPASRLITSYPIPPQESFTCAPYSIRIRRAGDADVLRYTFIATRDASSSKITLFKDIVHRDGKTTSTTTSQVLDTSAVQYITCATAKSATSIVGDILVTCRNGELACLSAESLAIRWSGSSLSAVQDIVASTISDFKVEYATSGSLTEFREGLFKDRPEVFTALPRRLDYEPELVVLISRSVYQGQECRHLIVLAAALESSSHASDMQKLIPLEVVPLAPLENDTNEQPTYQIDIQLGVLLQLQQGTLGVYEIAGTVPKLKSVVQMNGAESFIRLSKPFILSSSKDSIGLYNHQYRSVHGQTDLDLSELPTESQKPQSCRLLSYLRSQDLAVALFDNVLVSMQIEPPKNRGKRRKEGLLIDSIGRGAALEMPSKKAKTGTASMEFSRQVPGTITESYLSEIRADMSNADEYLSNNDLGKWEELLRHKFEIQLRKELEQTNGDTKHLNSQETPDWAWLTDRSYPIVDRRWVIYALSRVFSAQKMSSDESRTHLRLVLPDTNVTTYLVVAGHLSLTNIITALREELGAAATDNATIARDLVQSLADADPSMSLLLNYLQSTKMGEDELLLAIQTLMLSIDLIPDANKLNKMNILKNEANYPTEKYEMDLDDLEREIAVTEHYLEDDSSSRLRGLTLAFTKLWRLPAVRTVQALRRTLKTEEILALIYLLRVELVRGAWTSLYVDQASFEAEGSDPPPDGVIALIADLLGRCLDAIGSGGWLYNDAMSWADKNEAGDFLTALKLEASAALEGIEEAVFLNGLVGEVVRFGYQAQKSTARQTWDTSKPVPMQLEGKESRMLPLGLKARQVPTKNKVVSGGEVVQRSVRETGHLISQKVEAYSLEKLAI